MRLNQLILVIGVRGTGKTTITRTLAAKAGKRLIVVDTDDHPAYSDLETIDLTQACYNTSSSFRLVESDVDGALEVLNRHQTNAFVILEDAAKYIGPQLTKQQKAFIIDMRKRNFDVAIMFHSLSDVPPYLCRNYNKILLFKIADNLNLPQRKFNNWEAIKQVAARVIKNKNFNYCEVINQQ